jgi:hypothetical protein
MNDRDEEAPEIAALRARARFADDGTRAVLRGILDDLTHRLEDRTIAAHEAAPIVDRLSAFCAPPERPDVLRTLPALRALLDPERCASRARELAAAYARLAKR